MAVRMKTNHFCFMILALFFNLLFARMATAAPAPFPKAPPSYGAAGTWVEKSPSHEVTVIISRSCDPKSVPVSVTFVYLGKPKTVFELNGRWNGTTLDLRGTRWTGTNQQPNVVPEEARLRFENNSLIGFLTVDLEDGSGVGTRLVLRRNRIMAKSVASAPIAEEGQSPQASDEEVAESLEVDVSDEPSCAATEAEGVELTESEEAQPIAMDAMGSLSFEAPLSLP